jgi:hypothetical protein
MFAEKRSHRAGEDGAESGLKIPYTGMNSGRTVLMPIKWPAACVFLALAMGSAAPAADLASEALPPEAAGGLPPQNAGGANTEHKIALGLRVSGYLGVGLDGAVEVTRKSNIRLGFNFFNYSFTESKDGIGYDSELHLRSGDLLYDWFPLGSGFHLSGGLLYNRNVIKANPSVPAGETFTLGGVPYVSQPSNPIYGSGEVYMGNKVAPMGLVGWGNLIPRTGRHLSVNFEIGAAFVGAPRSSLVLSGGACVPSTPLCVDTAYDPVILTNIAAEEKQINNGVSFLKVLPVVSAEIGYRF